MNRRFSKGRNGLWKITEPPAGGTPVTPLFFSDFTAATGTSSTARSDGGKWNLAANDVVVEVNPGTLGFPSNMANVLRIPWYPFTGGLINRKGGILGPPDPTGILPIPAVGDVQYYRYYYRNDQPYPVTDEQTHPVQDGSTGGTLNFEMTARNTDGADATFFVTQMLFNGPSTVVFNAPLVLRHHTYRFEWRMYRDSTTTFKFDVRVYDEAISALTPLYTGDDYIQTLPIIGSPPTLTEYFASTSHTFQNVLSLEGINIGVNDGGIAGEDGDYGYQNGVVITRNETYNSELWIGPYGATYVNGEAA